MQQVDLIVCIVVAQLIAAALIALIKKFEFWPKWPRFLEPEVIPDANIDQVITGATHAHIEDHTGAITAYDITGPVEQRRGNFCFEDWNGFRHKAPIDRCAIFCSDGTVHGRIDYYEPYLKL